MTFMKKEMIKQPQGLISVLLDTNSEFGDRDDAAMDLSGYDEPEAEIALMQIASNPNEDPELLDTCGESLAEIWIRQEKLDFTKIAKISNIAHNVALSIFKAHKPAWADNIQQKS